MFGGGGGGAEDPLYILRLLSLRGAQESSRDHEVFGVMPKIQDGSVLEYMEVCT